MADGHSIAAAVVSDTAGSNSSPGKTLWTSETIGRQCSL